MKQKDFDIVDFEGFVSLFMREKDDSFTYTKSPIQVYPLSIASKYIKTPVPLFRAKYNFLLLFQDGGGTQQVDNEIFALSANDVLFIREGHLNAIREIAPGTSGYFIYVDSTLLPQIYGSRDLLNHFTFQPRHTVAEGTMEWICRCCELLTDAQRNKDKKYNEISTSLLGAVVQKLSETWPNGAGKADRRYEIAMVFKELLYDHFLEKRDVAFYANALAVSENYLTRCVKGVTQRSPKQHINEMVIFQGKLLLQDTSKDIAQIAFELNFSDPSYFGRLFKELTGQTPSDYRLSTLHVLSE